MKLTWIFNASLFISILLMNIEHDTYPAQLHDENWLKDENFSLWKERRLMRWNEEGIDTFAEELADLAEAATKALDSTYVQSALYPYNFLRELLDLPMASSVTEIDKPWLDELRLEVEALVLIERYGWKLPTEAQKELTLEASRLLGLKQQIVPLSSSSELGSCERASEIEKQRHYIVLCETPDLDIRLFYLYHELGHTAHNDSRLSALVDNKEADPRILVNESDFKSDIEEIKKYVWRGIAILPSLRNTLTGITLTKALNIPWAQEILIKYGWLWDPPKDPEEKDQMIYVRGNEQRADLFSFKQLLKTKNISAILTMIYLFGTADYAENYLIIKGAGSDHSSLAEIALYAIGFLAYQGFDVGSLLEQWEKTGICRSGEKEENYAKLFTPAWSSPLVLQIEKAYKARKKRKAEPKIDQ